MMFVKVAAPQINDADIEAAVEAMRSGRLTSGPQVAEFERRFAEYVGTRHAIAVNSGTAALHAALAAIDLQPGDEVIVPALTFFSTVTSVIHQGGVPVFCDIAPENFSMQAQDLPNRLTPRTKAIIPVHYFGHSADMDPISRFAADHGLKVIEDCAQAHGTRYRDRMVGSIGDAGAFSLFATKHITTCEGGMITTDSDEMDHFARSFRSHGLEGRNDHVRLGYNYRMPEPLGALGLSQLSRIEGLTRERIASAEKLIAAIRDIPWLTVPTKPDHVRHTYFWCHIWIDEDALGMPTRDLIETLREHGIEVRHRYEAPLYRQPLLTTNLPPILKLVAGKHLPDYPSIRLPNVERIAGRVIGLPCRPDLTDEEIGYIARVLSKL